MRFDNQATATLNGNDVSSSLSVDTSTPGQVKVSSSTFTISPGDTLIIDLVNKYAVSSGPYTTNQWYKVYSFSGNLSLSGTATSLNLSYAGGSMIVKSDPTTGIAGYVYDASHNGLGGVTVSLQNLDNASTTTDATGFYSFLGLTPGSYTAAITTISENTITQSAQVTTGNVTEVDFTSL